ncbi:SAM-dependent DNA methyltransferase [Candidatus Saccharibacteria bacterium]|nr:SAM-dependent DNA methyltransferase [Candidatus Saccharibacteria bacterium]
MDIQHIEEKLWQAADKLRNNMDAAEYKHVVLGLIFLKYISDAFEQKHSELAEDKYADPEDKDEYQADNIFWVPKEARWSFLKDNAKQPNIGVLIDDAMDAIERDNPTLKGVLPKNYAREALDKRRLGELIDTFSNISFEEGHESKDLLGRIYEYFMGMFADAEGKRGGQFYTPRSIVRLLVNMLAPQPGARIYDPCCGSGGMFVQSEEFIETHKGKAGDIAVYGQESNQTTWRLAKMNMAIRGIGADIKFGDTLHNDQLPDLKADFVLANPPFNISDWGGELLKSDARWKYGSPPTGNANFAWVQHFIHHLAPTGTAGFVLANGSMSSQSSGEGEIRKNLVEADLVDCIVTLPSQLFFNVAIPCCLWFISRDRKNRSGKTLFIDGRNHGHMINRRVRELSDDDIKKVASVYGEFRNDGITTDVPGFAKVAKLAEVKEHDYVLTPGRYVGSEEVEEDDEVFTDKMQRLTIELNAQFAKSHELEEKIKESLRKIDHERST